MAQDLWTFTTRPKLPTFPSILSLIPNSPPTHHPNRKTSFRFSSHSGRSITPQHGIGSLVDWFGQNNTLGVGVEHSMSTTGGADAAKNITWLALEKQQQGLIHDRREQRGPVGLGRPAAFERFWFWIKAIFKEGN